MNFAKQLYKLLCSFGFASILLLFLLLLTWLGTLEQIDHGLFETQKKYFESVFLWHQIGPLAIRMPWADATAGPLAVIPQFSIPLPGVYLLLALLLVNLVCGGIVRLKKDQARAGILIAHLGIILMLVAGFVKFRWSIEGSVAINTNEVADRFSSYYDWELTIRDGAAQGMVREQLIADADWRSLEPGKTRRFTSDELPFDVLVTRQFRNCRVVPKGPMFAGDGPVLDGYVVLAREPEKEAEQNVPGLYVTFVEKATGKQTDAIVWGLQDQPLTCEAGGKSWVVDLARKSYPLPFAVRLEKFDVEFHPGIAMARTYASDVTRIEKGQEQKQRISMNEPLRHEGYTLYQTNWGPQGRDGQPVPGEKLYSVLTVVQNPSDQWPKWSCFVIATGLLIHFSMKLYRYIENPRRLAAAVPSKES